MPPKDFSSSFPVTVVAAGVGLLVLCWAGYGWDGGPHTIFAVCAGVLLPATAAALVLLVAWVAVYALRVEGRVRAARRALERQSGTSFGPQVAEAPRLSPAQLGTLALYRDPLEYAADTLRVFGATALVFAGAPLGAAVTDGPPLWDQAPWLMLLAPVGVVVLALSAGVYAMAAWRDRGRRQPFLTASGIDPVPGKYSFVDSEGSLLYRDATSQGAIEAEASFAHARMTPRF